MPQTGAPALDRAVMVFGGEYDLACKEHLRSDLARLSDVRHVVLDFTDVTYVDSSVVVELIGLHRSREGKGYEPVAIVVKNHQLKKLFSLLSLDTLFRFGGQLGDVLPKAHSATALEYATFGERTWSHEHPAQHLRIA